MEGDDFRRDPEFDTGLRRRRAVDRPERHAVREERQRQRANINVVVRVRQESEGGLEGRLVAAARII